MADKRLIKLGSLLPVVLTRAMGGQIGVAISLAQAQTCERKEWLSGRTFLSMAYQCYESSRNSGVPRSNDWAMTGCKNAC